MKTKVMILGLIGILFISSNCISAPRQKKSPVDTYAVVVSKTTYADSQWRAVADALVKKRSAELITFEGEVETALSALQTLHPKYTAFVFPPQQLDKPAVKRFFELTRKYDSDPYGDTIWGIITGRDAAGAMKLVTVDKPLTCRSSLNTSFVNPDLFDHCAWLSDGAVGEWGTKDAQTGKVTKAIHANGRRAKPENVYLLVDYFNTHPVDMILTSAHGSQMNIQMPFTNSAICSNHKPGHIVTASGGRILSNSEIATEKDATSMAMNHTEHDKIFFPVGNCLVGDVKRSPDSMTPTMISHYGARQCIGYTEATWFGAGGWGILYMWEKTPARLSLAEAWFLNCQWVMDRLIRAKAGDLDVRAHRWNNPRGLAYDLNAVPLYGDPQWVAKLDDKKVTNPIETNVEISDDEQTVTLTIVCKEGATKMDHGKTAFGVLLPKQLPAASDASRVTVSEGKQHQPMMTDDFILLRNPIFKDNTTCKIVFNIAPLS